jgi:hypothetical protein
VQPLRLAFGPILELLSHSAWYNQASAADPQLYVPMTSHSKRKSGSTNQDMMFPLPSEKRKPATICHSHARAYLNTEKMNEIRKRSIMIHMLKTRPSIPLNDGVLSILRAGVKVSCELPGVDVHRLPVLLVHGNVGGRRPLAALMKSLHPFGVTVLQIGLSSMGRPRIVAMSCSITVVSPHEK